MFTFFFDKLSLPILIIQGIIGLLKYKFLLCHSLEASILVLNLSCEIMLSTVYAQAPLNKDHY